MLGRHDECACCRELFLHGGHVDRGGRRVVQLFDDRGWCSLRQEKPNQVDASKSIPCSSAVGMPGNEGKRSRLSIAMPLTKPAWTGGTAVGLKVQK